MKRFNAQQPWPEFAFVSRVSAPKAPGDVWLDPIPAHGELMVATLERWPWMFAVNSDGELVILARTGPLRYRVSGLNRDYQGRVYLRLLLMEEGVVEGV
jgi:hypothetical protein